MNPGDYLTSSAKFPGYAMKATRSGQIIGTALVRTSRSRGFGSFTAIGRRQRAKVLHLVR